MGLRDAKYTVVREAALELLKALIMRKEGEARIALGPHTETVEGLLKLGKGDAQPNVVRLATEGAALLTAQGSA